MVQMDRQTDRQTSIGAEIYNHSDNLTIANISVTHCNSYVFCIWNTCWKYFYTAPTFIQLIYKKCTVDDRIAYNGPLQLHLIGSSDVTEYRATVIVILDSGSGGRIMGWLSVCLWAGEAYSSIERFRRIFWLDSKQYCDTSIKVWASLPTGWGFSWSWCIPRWYLLVKSVRGTRSCGRSTSAQNRQFRAIPRNSVTRTFPTRPSGKYHPVYTPYVRSYFLT